MKPFVYACVCVCVRGADFGEALLLPPPSANCGILALVALFLGAAHAQNAEKST